MKNLKVRKYFNMGRRFVFSLALFVLVFVVANVVRIQAAGNVTGWLWGGTEDFDMCDYNHDGDQNDPGECKNGAIDGNETGVGWISMNNTNPEITPQGATSYGVNIPSSDGPIIGTDNYAWSENIGWISFNAADLGGCTGASGARREGDFLKGWARIIGIRDAAGNSGGWLGCVKLSSEPGDPVPYGVEISKMLGVESGSHTYAWSYELGWIDFGQAATCTNPSCSTHSLCEDAKLTSCNPTTFCSGDLDATCTITGDTSWTCSNGCGSVDCSAFIQPSVDGNCGTADGGSLCQGRAPTNADLCAGGTPNPPASSLNLDTYEVKWTCEGICSSVNEDCSAQGKKACGWIETNP